MIAMTQKRTLDHCEGETTIHCNALPPLFKARNTIGSQECAPYTTDRRCVRIYLHTCNIRHVSKGTVCECDVVRFTYAHLRQALSYGCAIT